MLIFDIETGPQPEEVLRKHLPPLDESQFEVGEFDSAAVKTGNLKDQKKIDEKIEAARKEHEKQKQGLAKTVEAARRDHWESFRDVAPLDAAYGRVVAIGLYAPESDMFYCDPFHHPDGDGDEFNILSRFWSKCAAAIHKSRSIIGLNTHQFDLPFLVRRSWLLGVDVPNIIVSGITTKWPKWNDRFIDLRQVWLLGAGQNTKSNFGVLSHAFGTSGKTEEEGGKYFWRLWDEDRERAVAYLEQDVRQPAEWAERMGIQ